MVSVQVLLSVLVLTLVLISVDGGNKKASNHNYDLSGRDLARLLGSSVHQAELMRRPIGSSTSSSSSGGNVKLSGLRPEWDATTHSGVRVTLEDGSTWLVHKGRNYGVSSQTVVTDARHMSSAWQPVLEDGSPVTRDFEGTKTISDLVETGGSIYRLLTDNCHHAADRIMHDQ